MKRLIVVFTIIIFVSGLLIAYGAPPAPSQGTSQPHSLQQVQPLAQMKIKKPLKIKLKRNSKDDYSWEISGENVDDIMNADKKLRKGLGLD